MVFCSPIALSSLYTGIFNVLFLLLGLTVRVCGPCFPLYVSMYKKYLPVYMRVEAYPVFVNHFIVPNNKHCCDIPSCSVLFSPVDQF